jgi:LacI family transcriptional regulator
MKQKKKKVFIHLDSGRGFSRELLRGIYEYNNKLTHWGIIFQSAYYLNPDDFSRVNLSMIRAHQPDGCILAYCKNIKDLKKMNIPVIQTTSINKTESIPYVMGNYDADGKMAVEYLLSLGFKNMGFFGVNKLSWSKGRCYSTKKYCDIYNVNLFIFNHETNLENITYKSHFNKLLKWLKSLPKPIGILACNDDFGQILINACSMAGIKVPYEIAVLGVDNDELICNITFPNMSSISRNLIQTASDICSLLSKMMDGEKLSSNIINTEPEGVVVRQSTDTIASDDQEVIKAIMFIRKNSHLPITVEQVVNETTIGKRRLYTRFKNVTGHSIHHEIQYTKLQRFKKLLKDSNQSIAEIAYQLGFEDVTHVSRWFHSLEGISPTQWKNENMI